MLTPSSNTILEPLTGRILTGLYPDVTAHFGRLRVTRISMDGESTRQFRVDAFLEAAAMLADAKVHAIAWNGTSASWLGFNADIDLCRQITAATGIAATSSVLAINEYFERAGVRKFALVTPYLEEVQKRIIGNYAAAGYDCVAERHLEEAGNFSFSEVTEVQIEQMIREVAATRPDTIVILCTNLRGAAVAARLETELGIPILDSVSVTLWKSLLMAGIDTDRIQGWGSVFQFRG